MLICYQNDFSIDFIYIFVLKQSISSMAYNPRNKHRHYRYIVDVYSQLKQEDITDSFIIRVEFPKRGIFISYRTWMNIKGKKPSELNNDNQLALF